MTGNPRRVACTLCVVVVAPYGWWLSLLGVNKLPLDEMIALEDHTKG